MNALKPDDSQSMKTFLIILSHFSRGSIRRANCDNDRQLSSGFKECAKRKRTLYFYALRVFRQGDGDNRKPLHNVQSSGIGNKESRPIINSPWNRMIIYYFPSIMAAALLDAINYPRTDGFTIFRCRSQGCSSRITRTNRTQCADAFERKPKIDRSSYCGISFPDGNYGIPSFVTSYSHGNCFRNNEFYVLCGGILLTSKLGVIAGCELNGVPEDCNDRLPREKLYRPLTRHAYVSRNN